MKLSRLEQILCKGRWQHPSYPNVTSTLWSNFSFVPACQVVCKSKPAKHDIGPRFEISQQAKFRIMGCSSGDSSSSTSSELYDLSLILLLIVLMIESAKSSADTQFRRGVTLSPRLWHNNLYLGPMIKVKRETLSKVEACHLQSMWNVEHWGEGVTKRDYLTITIVGDITHFMLSTQLKLIDR